MLLTMVPFDLGGDLGGAYNEAMSKLGKQDWACFLDHDAMFTTRTWYKQVSEAISQNPKAGAFTCVTNRLNGPQKQIAPGSDPHNHDQVFHRELGGKLAVKHGSEVEDITLGLPISGVVIVISKKAWLKVGGFKHGFLGVDNEMHRSLMDFGYRVFLLPGVYVYHWYRANMDSEHLDSDVDKKGRIR